MAADGAAEESVQVVVSCSDSSFPHPLPFNSDHTFHSDQLDLPEGFFSDLDFDFSLDNLYFPFDAHGFHPNTCPVSGQLEEHDLQSFEPSFLPDPVDFDLRRGNSGGHFSNDTKSSDSSDFHENQAWDASRVLECQPEDATFCDRETPQQVSSGDSRVIDVINSSSPSSCSSRHVSGSSPSSHDVAVKSDSVVYTHIKSDDSSSIPKRKKNDEIGSSKYTKFQRFDSVGDVSKHDTKNGKIEEEEDDKRQARLIRNRESAQLSRQRQKHYVEELEEKVKTMHFTIQDLSSKISYIMAENSNLRQQLCGNGMVRPAAGVYTPPSAVPFGYPWFSFPPCIVKSKGSQVPLVPIPKLKPHQTATVSKSKSQKRKSQIKTKKVASVSFLGVLFFMLFFGVLVPVVKVKHVGVQDVVFNELDHGDNYGNYQQHGRMLTINDDRNRSNPNIELCKGAYCNHLLSELELHSDQREVASHACHRVVKSGVPENSTVPIAASLFVPRNDKLVKIDGNLIIHSVLASERAMESQKSSKVIKSETGLVVAGKVSPSFSISENGSTDEARFYRSQDEAQRALTSGSSGFKDASSATASDGELQQWFHEGLSGPMMRSGMCEEVFQFDISSHSSTSSSSVAIVMPPSAFTNQTAAETPPPPMYTSRNRRVLQKLTLPPPSPPPPNSTTDTNSGSRHPPHSSIVVSVLLDPRHASDKYGGGGGGGGGVSSRPIFVILLLDSVKYVTYSCMLPLKFHLSTSF